MARKTNKAQVLELAAKLGVDVEYGVMGSEGFEVALYGYGAHMAFDPMAARNPYRPAPVALTHSNHHHNA